MLGEACAELLASVAVGSVVFVIGQRFLAAGDAAAMDGNPSDDIDATAALRTLLGLSIGCGFEIECR